MKVCKKCSKEFPEWTTIDGVKKNLQRRSYCLECSPWTGKSGGRYLERFQTIAGIEHKRCSVCKVFKIRADYHASNNGHWQPACKKCQNDYVRRKQWEAKSRAVKYKGSCCDDCDNLYPDYIYDFHHLDPSQKNFNLSSNRLKKNDWDAIKLELDKCVMLCSNCHRTRHWGQERS